jgi:hypothetical protein
MHRQKRRLRPGVEAFEGRCLTTSLALTGLSTTAGGGAQVSHLPGPTSKLPALNQQLLNYARSHLGKQVGNGECAMLAYLGLNQIHANCQLGSAGPNANYVWGRKVATLTPRSHSTAGILPGDIIQYSNVELVHTTVKKVGNTTWTSWSTMTATHHTAIVASVSGNTITVYQQNVTNSGYPPKVVQIGTLNLNDMKQGTLWVYRPVAR